MVNISIRVTSEGSEHCFLMMVNTFFARVFMFRPNSFRRPTYRQRRRRDQENTERYRREIYPSQ